jgi:hypothetical protein
LQYNSNEFVQNEQFDELHEEVPRRRVKADSIGLGVRMSDEK